MSAQGQATGPNGQAPPQGLSGARPGLLTPEFRGRPVRELLLSARGRVGLHQEDALKAMAGWALKSGIRRLPVDPTSLARGYEVEVQRVIDAGELNLEQATRHLGDLNELLGPLYAQPTIFEPTTLKPCADRRLVFKRYPRVLNNARGGTTLANQAMLRACGALAALEREQARLPAALGLLILYFGVHPQMLRFVDPQRWLDEAEQQDSLAVPHWLGNAGFAAAIEVAGSKAAAIAVRQRPVPLTTVRRTVLAMLAELLEGHCLTNVTGQLLRHPTRLLGDALRAAGFEGSAWDSLYPLFVNSRYKELAAGNAPRFTHVCRVSHERDAKAREVLCTELGFRGHARLNALLGPPPVPHSPFAKAARIAAAKAPTEPVSAGAHATHVQAACNTVTEGEAPVPCAAATAPSPALTVAYTDGRLQVTTQLAHQAALALLAQVAASAALQAPTVRLECTLVRTSANDTLVSISTPVSPAAAGQVMSALPHSRP